MSYPSRIHFTNERDTEEFYPQYVYFKCYCGKSFGTFTGRYRDSVWHYHALRTGQMNGYEDSFCKECIENPDLALDMLADVL